MKLSVSNEQSDFFLMNETKYSVKNIEVCKCLTTYCTLSIDKVHAPNQQRKSFFLLLNALNNFSCPCLKYLLHSQNFKLLVLGFS